MIVLAGEDRWLCTLLLKQGWRIEYNAASDAYTNAPEEFKEFYNQVISQNHFYIAQAFGTRGCNSSESSVIVRHFS